MSYSTIISLLTTGNYDVDTKNASIPAVSTTMHLYHIYSEHMRGNSLTPGELRNFAERLGSVDLSVRNNPDIDPKVKDAIFSVLIEGNEVYHTLTANGSLSTHDVMCRLIEMSKEFISIKVMWNIIHDEDVDVEHFVGIDDNFILSGEFMGRFYGMLDREGILPQ